jgi:meiotically up-regulated gene 157 (Mug157) protein
MGIIVRAMTSTDEDEIKRCLLLLETTHDNTVSRSVSARSV